MHSDRGDTHTQHITQPISNLIGDAMPTILSTHHQLWHHVLLSPSFIFLNVHCINFVEHAEVDEILLSNTFRAIVKHFFWISHVCSSWLHTLCSVWPLWPFPRDTAFENWEHAWCAHILPSWLPSTIHFQVIIWGCGCAIEMTLNAFFSVRLAVYVPRF